MPKIPHVAEDPFCECEKCKRRNSKMRDLFFRTEQGREVLGFLLEDMTFFRAQSDDGDRILNNFAKILLWKVGAWKSLTSSNFVHAMGNILPKG